MSQWIAVFSTLGGDSAGTRVTFDAEDWTFQAAEQAANEMADKENKGVSPADDAYMLVKLYTEAQLAALDGPEEQVEEQDWAEPILKALESIQVAARHGRTNKKAVKVLAEQVPKFLSEYAELTKLATTMMAAWEQLKEAEGRQYDGKTSSGLVMATTADVAAVRQRKGL